MKLLMCCHFPPLPGSKTMAQSIKLGEWKMHATAEPDKSVRFGEFCLRVPDDSHRTSSKSVTQRPMKSAHLTKQTTQQPTTEPTDLGSPSTQQTTEPDYFLIPETLPTRQPYADIIVRQIAPLNLQSHDYLLLAGCYCDKSEKKHLNETSALLSLMMQFPSETCTSAEYIGELKDGSKVCMTRLSFLDYYNAISSPQPEPANEGSSYEEPLVRSPTLLDPTTELPITTHPSVTESKQHDPTLQMTQAPQHTTHGCESCNFKTHSDDIDPKAVQSVNVTMQSSSCPVHIYVSLKDEDFCLDLDWPPFMRMLMKLEKEILSAHEDWMPKNISSCHCQERETKSPNETSPVTSTRIWLPSETCISTEFIETLMDGREVCVIGRRIFAYFGLLQPLYPTSSIRNGAAGEEGQQGTHGEPGPLAPQRIPGQAGIPGQPGQRGPPGIYGPPGTISLSCPHCKPFKNWHNIKPKNVQSVKIDVRSLHCPIIIHVTLKKNKNFCVDSYHPGFRTLLEKLKI